jgi:hypothetical protein
MEVILFVIRECCLEFESNYLLCRAFPSKATAARKKKLSELEPKVNEIAKKIR